MNRMFFDYECREGLTIDNLIDITPIFTLIPDSNFCCSSSTLGFLKENFSKFKKLRSKDCKKVVKTVKFTKTGF